MKDDELLARIEENYAEAGLEERRRTMLQYVDKLTRTPSEMKKQDVEALRNVGFSDEDILAIAEVAGYYAFANRIVDGLGVELEED